MALMTDRSAAFPGRRHAGTRPTIAYGTHPDVARLGAIALIVAR